MWVVLCWHNLIPLFCGFMEIYVFFWGPRSFHHIIFVIQKNRQKIPIITNLQKNQKKLTIIFRYRKQKVPTFIGTAKKLAFRGLIFSNFPNFFVVSISNLWAFLPIFLFADLYVFLCWAHKLIWNLSSQKYTQWCGVATAVAENSWIYSDKNLEIDKKNI